MFLYVLGKRSLGWEVDGNTSGSYPTKAIHRKAVGFASAVIRHLFSYMKGGDVGSENWEMTYIAQNCV